MNTPDWYQDPRVLRIAPEKLDLLFKLAGQLEGKTKSQAMPILVGALAAARRQHLQFTADEFDLIFSLMKEGKSEEEKERMDTALHKARQTMQKKP